MRLPGVMRSNAMRVLRTVKETTALALPTPQRRSQPRAAAMRPHR